MHLKRKTPLLAIAALFGAILSAHAQLAFSTDVKEFHPELSTQEIKTQFSFINIGNAPVTIKEIKPSCGCTVAASDKMIYAPGEKGIIDVTYTLHSSTGYQEKQIAITTVEDPNSIKVLTIKAYIPSLVTYSPSTLTWKIGDAIESKTIKIKLTAEKGLKLIGIEWTTDKVIAKLHTVKDGDSYTISVIPLSTDDPITGLVILKLLLPSDHTPKLAFIPFSVAQPKG